MKLSDDIMDSGTILDSDCDSTSTELCDDSDRLIDVNNEEPKPNSNVFIIKKANVEEEKSLVVDNEMLIIEKEKNITSSTSLQISTKNTSIPVITNQIQKSSEGDVNLKFPLDNVYITEDQKILNFNDSIKNNQMSDLKLFSDRLSEGKQSASLKLNKHTYLIDDKKTIVTQSLETENAINNQNSTVWKLFGESQYIEEKISDSLTIKNFISKEKSIVPDLNDSFFFNEKISAPIQFSNSNKLNNNKKLMVSLKLKVSDSVYEKDSIPILNLIDHKHFMINKSEPESNNYVSKVQNSCHNYNFFESESGVDIIEEIAMKNTSNIVNKKFPILSIKNDSNYDEITDTELKYSTKSNYEIKNLSSIVNTNIREKDENLSPEFINSIDEAFITKNELVQNNPNNRTTYDSSPDNEQRIQIEFKDRLKHSKDIDFFESKETSVQDVLTPSLIINPINSCSESSNFILSEKSIFSYMNSDSKKLKDSLQIPIIEQSDSFINSKNNSTELKYPKRILSPELKSRTNINSITFVTNSHNKFDEENACESLSGVAVTSPFYSLLRSNKKSSLSCEQEMHIMKSDISCIKYTGIKEEKQDLKIRTPIQTFVKPVFKNSDENINIKITSENDSFNKTFNNETLMKKKDFNSGTQSNDSNDTERFRGYSFNEKINNIQIHKTYEKRNSDLEKQFSCVLLSPSIENFSNNTKKRYSSASEDLRFVEAKAIDDEKINLNRLTKKKNYMAEDSKKFGIGRQDIYSNSISNFSINSNNKSEIKIYSEGCETYIPKSNIHDNCNSFLKTVTYKNSIGNHYNDYANQDELKLGVWTKVKPHRHTNSVRKSSERAFKIIQENSAILRRILTCQAKKNLPDLEEISKNITISPINEEISKIFSPILEKMGLIEDEINEKLSKINLNELDRNTTITSESDKIINDELLKLSLISDNDKFECVQSVDHMSPDFLIARDTYIDHQINEELSKLINNYDEASSIKLKKHSTDLNAPSIIPISKNMYSYTTSNDDFNIIPDYNCKDSTHSVIYPENPHFYTIRNKNLVSHDNFKLSDIHVYGQLEKIDQISHLQDLSAMNFERNHQNIISTTIPYVSDDLNSKKNCPSIIEKESDFTISTLKEPFNSNYNSSIIQSSTYNHKPKILSKKIQNTSAVKSYDSKNSIDFKEVQNSTFEFTPRKEITLPILNHEFKYKMDALPKENIEFHVTNNDCKNLTLKNSTFDNIDLELNSVKINNIELKNSSHYYSSNIQIINSAIKSETNNDIEMSSISALKQNNYQSNYQFKNFDNEVSVQNYFVNSTYNDLLSQSCNDKRLLPESQAPHLTDIPITIINQHQDIQVPSPHFQYSNYKVMNSSYTIVPTCIDNSLTKISVPISKIQYSDTLKDEAYKNSTIK